MSLGKPAPGADFPKLRDGFLRFVVAFGVIAVVLTESLGAFRLLRRLPLAFGWVLCAGMALVWTIRANRGKGWISVKSDAFVIFCALGCVAVLLLTALAAAFSPPNSADAMAYHLPRVVYWAEQASVRFFPTPYLNQIMLQPMAEYLMLHLFLLTGGDRWMNFVQWSASVVSIVGVSAVAAKLGAPPRAQALAALICATIPAGILASSGVKNDYVLAAWLVAAVYFASRLKTTFSLGDAVLCGCATGLALLTKATAYLFAPWLLAAVFFYPPPRSRRLVISRLAVAFVCALAINAPQYSRNYALSGSPLGFDSAQANGVFRWRNEEFGWRQTLSNALRNVSEQLGARSERWNQVVYSAVAGIHRRAGITVDDSATTWPGSEFRPPRNSNHEADAPSRWHLWIYLAAAVLLVVRAFRSRDLLPALYACALASGFVAFCFYLKWQPYMARMFLPLFVLAAPLVALVAGKMRRSLVWIALALFLLNSARPALFENWVRPLRGPRSVFRVPRNQQYFSDMTQWNNHEAYMALVARLAASRCNTIGIDINGFQLEYPLQALLRQSNPQIRFLHVNVLNSSAMYPQPVETAPCATAILP